MGWYKKESIESVYYTPFAKGITTYHFAGPGDRPATPKEMVELAQKIENKTESANYFSNSCIYSISTKHKQKTFDLPNGVYIHRKGTYDLPERLIKMPLREEAFLNLSNISKEVLEDIDNFKLSEPLYREDNIFFKLGFLLYGAPGNGKSSQIRQIITSMQNDAVIVYLYTVPSLEFLNKIKSSLKDRLKVFIFEEFLTVVEQNSMATLLNFLDGEHSVDKSITIATTNYPEKLPGNIVDRPSRFDKRYKFGNPNDVERKKLLEFYLKREVTKEEVIITKDLSIASLKEIALLVRIKKLEFKAAVDSLKKISSLIKTDFSPVKKMGFMGDVDDEI